MVESLLFPVFLMRVAIKKGLGDVCRGVMIKLHMQPHSKDPLMHLLPSHSLTFPPIPKHPPGCTPPDSRSHMNFHMPVPGLR